MNFLEKFGSGASQAKFDLVHNSHSGSITFPDAHLLFAGDYARSGEDLIVSDQLYRVVVPQYFHGEKRATLLSPDGAPLDSRVVDSLTGYTPYAQAAGVGSTAAKVVGNVVKMSGSASVVRNGVTITLNNGDAVYQTDVVQTGSNSTLGLVLVDGTTFNLTANARLMLNDLTYDATSTSNSSLFTLVEGAVSFVAGQVAKTGDMKVDTPTAVIGIRGTAVILNIDSTDGKVSISVVDQQDGQIHSVQVFKCVPVGGGVCTSGDLIGTVASNGASLTITPTAAAQVITQEVSKTAAEITQEFGVFQQVLSTYDVGKQLAPNTPPPSDGKRGDVNPQSTTKFAGNSTITPIEQTTGTALFPISNNTQHPDATTDTAISFTTPSSSAIVNPTPLPAAEETSTLVPNIPTTVVITSPVAVVGNILNQAAVSTGFIISGTAFSGSSPVSGQTVTVAIVDSANVVKEIFTTTVANGTWSVNVTAIQAHALADGSYNILATVSDTAGITVTTATQTLTFDTAAPTILISSPGITTNQAIQTIAGTVTTTEASAGTTVMLYDIVNGVKTQIGTASVNSDGTWISSVTLSGDGTHIIVAEDTDAAGNIGSSAPAVFTLVGSPAIAITSPVAGDNIVNKAEAAAGVIISGTATAGSAAVNGQTATITIVDSSNVVKDTYTSVVTGGAWSVNVTAAQAQALADGSYSIKADISDAVGNAAATASQTISLDTTAPTVAITSAGGPTNQASQTVTGTVDAADAGATVTILDGTTAVGTAVVQSNGSWSATGVTLTNGSNALTAKVTDAAGNSTTSTAVVYTLSTIGPSVTEALSIDTGSSSTDRITSSDVLSGSGLANTVVHFTVDGSPIAGTATTNAQGTWTFTPPALADGSHTIVASQTDSFGNTGSASLTFTLDTTAPTVAITSAGGPTNQASQTVTGTVDAADAGATVTILDGTTAVGTAVVQSNGSWSATGVTLTNGSNALTAKVTDAAGNSTTSTAVVYTLSTIGPSVTEALSIDTGSSSTDRITSSDVLSGSGLANTVVHFTVDGSPIAGTATTNAQGTWTFTPPALADGSHTIVASQTDSFGNTGSASLTFTLDTTAPTVAITSAGGPTNQASQTVTGTVDAADAGATVTILDGTTAVGTAVVQSNGSWSATGVTLTNGSNALTAKVTDAAGNSTTSTAVVYTLSTIGPSVTEALSIDTGSSSTDRITSSDVLSGSGLANTVVHFTVDGSPIAGTATTNAQGTWTFTPPALADGSHTIVASQTDSFGNTGSASLTFTLDTTAPTVAITSAGGPTNQASQTVTGTVDAADAGATVTILDGTTAVGTAVVQSNGSWSATGVTLTNGSNALTAKVTDAAGNSTTSTAVVYTLSTIGPSVTEALSIDTGSSSTDRITSSDVLSGSGLANTVVHFTVDGSPIAGTATTNAQGTWTFTPPALADGSHTIVASQTDSFGNTGSASLTFTLDTTAPTVAITSAGGPTNQASQTVTGTVDAADAGATVTILDGTTAVGTAVVQSNGSWSATGVTLTNGSNALTAKVTDAAGNSTTSTAVVYTLSTIGPSVTEALSIDTGSSSTDRITSSDVLSGSGLANTVVHFTVDGSPIAGTATTNAQGTWTFTPPALADGSHTIVASQTDSFGNTGSASLTFTLDTTAPTVAITSAGGPTNQASQTVTGTVDAADAGATVTILDGTTAVGTAVVQSNGSWSATGVTLTNGSNALTAKVTDAAGNSTTSTAVVYTLSTIGPSVTEALSIDTGSSSTDRITSSDVLSGSGLANTVVHFTVDGSPIAGTATTNAQGTWTFTPPALADGSHTIVASQTDSFGNTGSASLTFTLDTTAPTVAITSAGGPTNQASQTVTGTVDAADAGATVTILDGTTAVGTAVVQSNGSWSATGVTLTNGSNALTAKVTDAAGNSTTSTAVVYTLSTIGPSVTEALSIDTGSSSTDRITSSDVLSGSGLANTVVHFTVDGSPIAGTATTSAQGTWTFTPPALADGSHTIVASQTDSFGNTGSASLTFTLDTTAPTVAITSAGGPTNQASQTVTGTVDAADAGATVTILDGTTAVGTAVVQSNGSWSATGVTLTNGSNALTAKVTDAAGNSTTSTAVVYTLSTIGPSVTEALSIDTGSSSTDRITSSDVLSGSGLANTVVHFTVDGSPIAGTATTNAQGTWTFTPPALADGSHTIVASQTDSFGNTGSASLTFTLDTTAPTVAITSAGGPTNQASQTVTGTVDAADAGATVTILDGTTAVGTAVVQSNGSWSATGVTLTNGSNALTAKVTDAAGNSTTSTAVVYTLSTIGPSVTEALSIDTGSSSTDRITSSDVLSGSGLANTVVHFTVDGSPIAGTATTNAQGTWTFTPPALADGSHTIVASQTDSFGNTGSASLTFTLDTTAPTVAITSAGGPTNQPARPSPARSMRPMPAPPSPSWTAPPRSAPPSSRAMAAGAPPASR